MLHTSWKSARRNSEKRKDWEVFGKSTGVANWQGLLEMKNDVQALWVGSADR